MFSYTKLLSFTLILSMLPLSSALAERNKCIARYSSMAFGPSTDLVENLNRTLKSDSTSHPMIAVFSWLNTEFKMVNSEYNDFLVSLKKVGVDNKLMSEIEIANALYGETLKKLQDINNELDKKDPSSKKIKALSETLKTCSLKSETCMNNLKESATSTLAQIDKLKNYQIPFQIVFKILKK